MAAESVNTPSVLARMFMPRVAHAAGLSFMARSRWPNSLRRTQTTSSRHAAKATEPAMK